MTEKMEQHTIKELLCMAIDQIDDAERKDEPFSDYNPGDVVVYLRHTDKWWDDGYMEIGVVKSVKETGCFVAYHLGDTCAMTPFTHLCKAANGYAIGGLAERVKQLTGRLEPLTEGCEDWSER